MKNKESFEPRNPRLALQRISVFTIDTENLYRTDTVAEILGQKPWTDVGILMQTQSLAKLSISTSVK